MIQCVQYSELERRLEDLETRLCLLVAAGCLHLERQGCCLTGAETLDSKNKCTKNHCDLTVCALRVL